MKKNKLYPNVWKASDNSKISCKEKIVILNNNVIELQNLINQMIQVTGESLIIITI